MSAETVRAAFAWQADWAARHDAPFTAALCRAIERSLDAATPLGSAVLGWPGDPLADALALRLTGGLHALVRAGALPELAALYPPQPMPGAAALDSAVAVALADPRLLPWLDSPPQTNEVGRAALLYPGLMAVAAATGLPLRLFELGASAGLNLRMDRYAYRLGATRLGPPDATLTLAPEWIGAPPPAVDVRVVARAGVDRAPVDLTDPAARARLIAFVWPDQPERLARVEAAIATFAADPVPLATADAADWTEAAVALAPGSAAVVYHSIAWQYFLPETRVRIAAHLERLGAAAIATAPLAWLRFELDNPASTDALPALRLRLWPGGEDRLLARAHPHGASVEWLA